MFVLGCERCIVCEKKKLGRRIRVSCLSSVSATIGLVTFKDVIDFVCFERRQQHIGQYADALLSIVDDVGSLNMQQL